MFVGSLVTLPAGGCPGEVSLSYRIVCLTVMPAGDKTEIGEKVRCRKFND